MTTTRRSDLTTEIEKALTDEAYDGGSGPLNETQFSRHVRRLAETAVEVVREATMTEHATAIAKAAEQIAMFAQKHDAIRYGTVVDGVAHPTWDELGPDAAHEYLEDGRRTVRAMVALGWEPTHV